MKSIGNTLRLTVFFDAISESLKDVNAELGSEDVDEALEQSDGPVLSLLLRRDIYPAQ